MNMVSAVVPIEPLETRIAPAGVFIFTDMDGDTVTVKTSKGTNADLEAALQLVDSGTGKQLQVVNLTDPKWAGTTLTITAKQAGGEISTVNVGYVNGTGNDLGAVKIDGDLGAVDAGNPAKTAAALASLTVKSMGVEALATGATDLISNIDGALGKVTVGGDFKHAQLLVTDTSGKAKATIASIQIDRDLIGGTTTGAGKITADNKIGAVTIKGDFLGGAVTQTGHLQSGGAIGAVTIGGDFKHAAIVAADATSAAVGTIASVKIGGSFIGGGFTGAGKITADKSIGAVMIGVDFLGGTASQTGYLQADGTIGAVTINGDFTGGSASSAGRIFAGKLFSDLPAGIGAVKILGTFKGGSGLDSGNITSYAGLASLYIGENMEGGSAFGAGDISYSKKAASKLVIMGNMIGGTVPKTGGDAGYFYNTGEISAAGGFGSLYVGGSVLGGAVASLGNMKFGSVTIEGSLEGGAADFSGTITNWGPVGAVKIGGDLKGGTGRESGTLAIGNNGFGKATSIWIGGSVIGGTEVITGNIGLYADSGPITVVGSVRGNEGDLSGAITSFYKVTSITIGGDLVGSTGGYSGVINPPNSTNSYIGKVAITGSITGHTGLRSGSVWSLGTIGSMTVGGNVSAGDGLGSGGIRANTSIGSLTIEGDVTGDGEDPVYITGGGLDYATNEPKAMVALGKIVIKGNVTNAKILAGWDAKADQNSAFSHKPEAVNGDASITSVLVEGTWAASDIVAGVTDGTADGFGRNDTLISGDIAKAIAKIGSVTLAQTAVGSAVGGEHYGIVAEQIGTLKVNGNRFVTTNGKDSGPIDNQNFNFTYLEVERPT